MLIDEILQSQAPEEWPSGLPAAEIRRVLRQAFVVRGQNVWDYFSVHMLGTTFDRAKYPNVAPPLPTMWFEWTDNAATIIDPDGGVTRTARMKLGILCFSVDLLGLDEERKQTLHEEMSRFGINSIDEMRWAMGGIVFSRILEPGKRPHVMGRIDWRSGPNGELLPSAANGHFVYSVAPNYQEIRERMFDSLLMVAQVSWLAMSFMHCKNVRVEKGPAIPEKLRRARERNGKLPLFRHHTVIIDPSRPAMSSAPNGVSEGSAQALHICRGHFKDFRERGLFGRKKGVYWWPMHLRGSAANGTVGKDYEVRP